MRGLPCHISRFCRNVEKRRPTLRGNRNCQNFNYGWWWWWWWCEVLNLCFLYIMYKNYKHWEVAKVSVCVSSVLCTQNTCFANKFFTRIKCGQYKESYASLCLGWYVSSFRNYKLCIRHVMVKITMWICACPLMKACGGCRSITPRPPYSWERSPVSIEWEVLGGTDSWCGRFGKREVSYLYRDSKAFIIVGRLALVRCGVLFDHADRM
jgi:hypothetical protein